MTKTSLKKIMFFLLGMVAFTACQESMEERAERDARETTEKICPRRMNDEGTIILERITFDKATLTWKQDFLYDADPEQLAAIDIKSILLKELKNMPSYKPYMEHGFNFQYVYCNMKNPKDTVANVVLTKKDYQ